MLPAAIPARPRLARVSLIATDTTATISLYVDDPYASVVNDFFTSAGHDVETRERELVFLEMGMMIGSSRRSYSALASPTRLTL